MFVDNSAGMSLKRSLRSATLHVVAVIIVIKTKPTAKDCPHSLEGLDFTPQAEL